MTCRFLENLTLGALIAPVAEEEFRAHYWERKPLIVHRGDSDFYGDFFTVQDFDEAIARSAGYVKTVDVGNKKGTAVKFTTVEGLEAILADMRDGGSLILEQLHRQDPKLGLLCSLLGQEPGHVFERS